VLFTCDDECLKIPNHHPLEPSQKLWTITFTTCLGYITTAIGFVGFFKVLWETFIVVIENNVGLGIMIQTGD